MKNFEDIEKLSFEQLESIASDSSVQAPEGLKDNVLKSLTASSAMSAIKNKRHHRFVAISVSTAAAAMALALALVLTIHRNTTPVDTFSDPRLAYAELEKTFSYISSKVDKGFDIAEQAAPAMEKPSQVINKIRK